MRTFIKVGAFHRLAQFEDGAVPTAEEQQIFTWCAWVLSSNPTCRLTSSYRKDATLREVLTTLRSTAPPSTEYRHPLARYSFRAIYADSANRGRIVQKDLGMVYSRDILGEPGTLAAPAPRLLADAEAADEERTLDELRFVPGDYMCVMVHLPKNVAVAPAELSIKGSGAAAASAATGPGFANGWKRDGGRADGGWSGSLGGGAGGAGRGGGHWRGESSAPAPVPRGARGSGRGRADAGDRDRDRDRRGPPPRRESPPRRGGGWGDRDRERERGGRGRSISRSRSPGRRRNSRYD